jgi:integrase
MEGGRITLKQDMPRRLPKGCIEDSDRHGNIRIYYRPTKRHRKIRLRGTPWTPEFMAQYEAAQGNIPPAKKDRSLTSGTWRWLCVKYMTECTEYKRLGKRTRHVRKLILEKTYDEPIAPGSAKVFADFPLTKMDTNAVEVLRDRKMDTPEEANSWVKAIRQVFKFGTKKKHPDGKPYAPHNPARDVEYFKTGSTGWHTWTVDEVRQYQDHHAIGTKARLFLDLTLFLGVRRSDTIRLGKQHARKGKITFTQFKGRNKKPKRLTLPILPVLQTTLDGSAHIIGDLTFLINDLGRAFTDAGIGNKMRDWCDQAGLPHCTAHGLRKAGATIAAMNGATAHQLKAIFGWETLKQAEVYTREADQVRLAQSGMHLLTAENESGAIQGPTSD